MEDLIPRSVPEDMCLPSDDDLAKNDEILSKDNDCAVKKSRDSLWRGQYCCVPLCRHSHGEQEERKQLFNERLSFHSFPDMATDKERVQH